MDCSPPGWSGHGILQARALERVTVPSSRGSSPPGGGTRVSYGSCIGSWVLYHWEAPHGKSLCAKGAPSGMELQIPGSRVQAL